MTVRGDGIFPNQDNDQIIIIYAKSTNTTRVIKKGTRFFILIRPNHSNIPIKI